MARMGVRADALSPEIRKELGKRLEKVVFGDSREEDTDGRGIAVSQQFCNILSRRFRGDGCHFSEHVQILWFV